MFMKTRNIKKLIVGLAFIAVAAIAAWNVSENSNKYGLSDVSLANVEALARNEVEERIYQTMGYCRYGIMNMQFICVARHTAEPCRHDDCPE